MNFIKGDDLSNRKYDYHW